LKDTSGYSYTYADLPAIFKVINPLMKTHGLGFYQAVNGTKIKTVVFHVESGEIIESETDIPQGVQLAKMNDFQVLGSAITYIRRYALSSMLGLVTDKDTDASGEQVKTTPKATKPTTTSASDKVCSLCGTESKVSPKSGKDYCPNWQREDHKDGTFHAIVSKADKQFTDSLPEIKYSEDQQ